MNPALSVVTFTLLAGSAQGLVLALVGADWAIRQQWIAATGNPPFGAAAAVLAALLAVAGLAASVFHLGRPERAWRAAMQWRTSWLSREVIVLPAFIALVLAYAAALALGRREWQALAGGMAVLAALVLFVCTGMIYACMRFLREWATPLTPINFILLGTANGFTLAAALAALGEPSLVGFFATGALVATVAALAGRAAARQRNAAGVPKSTLQSALGIKHPRIEQKSQGFMGGSFNTREFFHGRSPARLRSLRRLALATAFVLPGLLLLAALGAGASRLATLSLGLATLLQYGGLFVERWLFFAEAQHPQNLYYQRMA